MPRPPCPGRVTFRWDESSRPGLAGSRSLRGGSLRGGVSYQATASVGNAEVDEEPIRTHRLVRRGRAYLSKDGTREPRHPAWWRLVSRDCGQESFQAGSLCSAHRSIRSGTYQTRLLELPKKRTA